MKIIYQIVSLIFTLNIACFGQSTLITPGNSGPNITATSIKSGIVLPRMTATQKSEISNLIAGMVVYDTDSNCVSVFNGIQWTCFKSTTSTYASVPTTPQYTQSQINSLSSPVGTLAFNSTTEALYVSDGNKMNPTALEHLDGNEIQTSLPIAWANGAKIPVFRIRHPNNVSGNMLNRKFPTKGLIVDNNKSGTEAYNRQSIFQDFKIMPYQYGMAVEYNGVLENWVGEFSVHRGFDYFDMGDGGAGWGAVLWVGDDYDYGGLRMTARNNTITGGNIKFTEISSELFSTASAGNLRLRVVDTTDRIDLIWGGRGSNNVVSFIGQTGIKFPSVSSVASIASPIKGLTVFDNADSTMKVFTGGVWGDLSINKYVGQTGIKFPSVSSVASIASPIKGLTVFDNADSTMKVFTGGVWGDLSINKYIGQTGIKFPSVSSVASIASPIKGLTVFDNADSTMKVFTGGVWGDLSINKYIGQTGIKFPSVSSVASIASPIKGLTVFDNADSTMKVFTGGVWGDLSINKYVGQTGIKFPSVSSVASIASPIKGLTVFDNADSTMKVFTGGVWGDLSINKYIGQTGIKFPSVSSVASIASPIKGLTVFDNADSTMKVFTGGVWGDLSINKYVGQTGIKFPSVSSVASIASPIKGLTVFDNADSTMKVFTGGVWGDLSINKYIGQTGIKFPSVSSVASIASPIKGLTVFDNADSTMKVFTGGVWSDLNNQRLTGTDSITTNITLSYASKQVQYVDASNGNIVITLSTISDNLSGLIFKIIRVDGSSNSVTVVAGNSSTINGVSSKSIQNQFDCMNLYSKGINVWLATREIGY